MADFLDRLKEMFSVEPSEKDKEIVKDFGKSLESTGEAPLMLSNSGVRTPNVLDENLAKDLRKDSNVDLSKIQEENKNVIEEDKPKNITTDISNAEEKNKKELTQKALNNTNNMIKDLSEQQSKLGEGPKKEEIKSRLQKAIEKRDRLNLFASIGESLGKIAGGNLMVESGVAAKPIDVDLSVLKKIGDKGVSDVKLYEEEELKDPNSSQSIAAREAFSNISGIPMERLGNISASELNRMQPTLMQSKMVQDKLSAQKELKGMELKEKQQEPKPLSKAQEAVDKTFAKDYVEWIGGGKTTVESNLDKLKGVRSILEKATKDPLSGISGRIVGNLPKTARTDESLAVQQDIESAVVGALRPTLGAQFTEKEAARILSQSFDPLLPEKENLKKLDTIIKDLESRAKRKSQAVNYFEKNESLSGYKQESPSETVSEEKVTVEKDGKKYKLPKRQLEKALSQGYKLTE